MGKLDNAVGDLATVKLKEMEAVMEMSSWRRATILLLVWFMFSVVAIGGLLWEEFRR